MMGDKHVLSGIPPWSAEPPGMQALTVQRPDTLLPDWVFERYNGRFTYAGLLYVRMQARMKMMPLGQMGVEGCLFSIGSVGVISVIPCKHDGEPSVAIVLKCKDDVMVLHDDAGLYPSDSLVTRLALLDNPQR